MSVPIVPADATVTTGRRALREARLRRRVLMGACALALAVCLGITLVLVNMARDRPVPSAQAPLVVTPDVGASRQHPQQYPQQHQSGAKASEGVSN